MSSQPAGPNTEATAPRPKVVTVRWLLVVLLGVAVAVALNLAFGDGLIHCPEGKQCF
jgi:hypothetical protein